MVVVFNNALFVVEDYLQRFRGFIHQSIDSLDTILPVSLDSCASAIIEAQVWTLIKKGKEMSIEVPNKLKKLFTPNLGGNGDPRHEKAACIMEFVNLISPKYEIWGTDALCVDETLTELSIQVNDATQNDSERKRMLRYAPRYLGTDFKKNHNKMTNGAWKWCKHAIEKYNLTYDDYDYVTGINKVIPYKITKKYDFNNWTSASCKLNEIWDIVDDELDTDRKRMNEFTNLLDTVLPSGKQAEPDWDRAKAYFEKGELPQNSHAW